jgi:hypothetical protein
VSSSLVREAVLESVLKIIGTDGPVFATISEFGLALPISELHVDSLDLLAICMEIEERIAVDIDPGELNGLHTLSDLADLVETKTPGERESITPADTDQPFPLSYEQETVWRYCQELGDPSSYAVSVADVITGPLQASLFLDCIRQLVRSHEILRMTFPVRGDCPVQQVNAPETIYVGLVETDNRETFSLSDLIDQHRLQIKDIEASPLSRFVLIRIAPELHLFVRSMHHMNSDRRSISIFIEELAALYEAKGDVRPSGVGRRLQYYDYSVWQRRSYHPTTLAYQSQISWWAEHFDGVQTEELPFRREKAQQNVDPSEGDLNKPLGADLVSRLRELANDLRCTTYSAWLTALLIVLRFAGTSEDIVVGIYVTTRRSPELRGVIGDFSNTVALRCKVRLHFTFAQTLADVAKTLRDIENFSVVPYQRVSEELNRAGKKAPAIKLIAFARPASDELEFANLKLKRFPEPQRLRAMPWGCSVSLRERQEGFSCGARFDANLYDPKQVGIFIDRVVALLDLATASPDTKLKNFEAGFMQENCI